MANKKPKFFPHSHPEWIFVHAEAFWNVAGAMKKDIYKFYEKSHNNMGFQTGIALKVNEAFACELYFKCISVIEAGGFYEGHDLKFLFAQLSQPTKKVLLERHKNIYYQPFMHGILPMPSNLEVLLEEAKSYFPDMRYIFQKDELHLFRLTKAIEMIREYILQLRPNFKNLIQS